MKKVINFDCLKFDESKQEEIKGNQVIRFYFDDRNFIEVSFDKDDEKGIQIYSNEALKIYLNSSNVCYINQVKR
ncbi:MAG: hypothetical protein ACFFAU_01210 [Candidatus Hodarchaeota archaeon]